MKASDLRSKTADEITSAMVEICREQFNLKMQKATGQLSKPDQIKKNRRTIARIQTILTEKGVKP
jgi:large subunit ribosomal protein L29